MSLQTVIDASLAGLLALFGWREISCLVAGVLMGSIVGILPGLGGAAALAFLLPFALELDPSPAFALLIGVAAVTATTGDLTSILLGVPGEPTSAATVVDGHAMARRGEAARAIGAALYSSLAGAIFGALVLAMTLPVGAVAIRAIASPELFMLAILGIAFVMPLAGVSRLKGALGGGLGLMLATVGVDPLSGVARYTFGQLSLWEGIGVVPVALGLFAVPEIVALTGLDESERPMTALTAGGLAQGAADVFKHWRVVLRSSIIGSAMGLVPGVGATVSQWIAYADAARRSPNRARFGSGAVEGVIAPATANNATLGGSLVPALVLGVPGSLTSAMLLTAFIMKGLVPGPDLLAPASAGGQLTLLFSLVWLLVAGNVLAVGLASCSTGLLVRIANVRARRLVPLLLMFAMVGALGERQAFADVLVMAAAGFAGMLFVRYDWPRAPMLLGLLLGGLAENRLFLSMQAYGFTWFTRPGVIAIAGILLLGFVTPVGNLLRKRRTAEATSDEHTAPLRHPDELVVMCALVGWLVTAFVVATSYGPRASLMPRLVSGATCALLVTVLVTEGPEWFRRRRQPMRASSPPWIASSVLLWIPAFLALAWTLGFPIGVPLAVLGYLHVHGERPATAATLAAGVWVFIDVIMFRWLGVAFPAGALVSWTEHIVS